MCISESIFFYIKSHILYVHKKNNLKPKRYNNRELFKKFVLSSKVIIFFLFIFKLIYRISNKQNNVNIYIYKIIYKCINMQL